MPKRPESFLSRDSSVEVISNPGIDDLVALALVDRLTQRHKLLTATFGNVAASISIENANTFCNMTGWSLEVLGESGERS